MSIINKISEKKEKNVLSNLFGTNSSDEDSDSGDDATNIGESNIENDKIELDEKIIFKTSAAEDLQIELIQKKQLGIAFQLWPAATLLAEYLINHPELLLPSTDSPTPSFLNAIELGAGLGLTGMYITKYFNERSDSTIKFNKTILTDLPEVMDILNTNILNNHLEQNVACCPLDWNNISNVSEIFNAHFTDITSPPIVIAADVVYWECLFLPLVNILEELCMRGCRIITSHIRRWKKDQKFFQLCKKRHLTVDTILENVEMVPHEHTKEPTKQISRIYLIYKTVA